MPAKIQKPKKAVTKKWFITSQIFNSSQQLDHVKELAFKEKATYRHSAPSEILTKEDLKNSREVVKNMQKMISVSKDGDMELKEVPFTHFDKSSWRFYIQPETLEDLENFVKESGFEAGINVIDPDDWEDDDEEAWSENQIGMPLPEEPFVILQLVDGFLLDENNDGEGGCGDPNCSECGGDDDDD